MSGVWRRGCWVLAAVALAVPLSRPAPAEPLTHTVRPGESIWTIARRYGVSTEDLVRLNDLRDARRIRSGLEIAIPQLGATADPPALDLGVPEVTPAAPVIVEPVTAKAAELPAGGSQPREQRQPAATAAARPQPRAACAVPPVVRRAQPQAPLAAAAAPVAKQASPGGSPQASAEQAAPALPVTLAEPSPVKGLFASSPARGRQYGLMTALDFALKFVLVLLLAYICALALRKFWQRRLAASGKGAALRVIDTIGLAPNRHLHIVALGDRAFLLGSTPESISLISDISQAPGVDSLLGPPRREQPDPAFAHRLRELMKAAPSRREAPPSAGLGARFAQAARFIRARADQLRPLGEIIDETVSG